ncbi:MAG: HemK2/MTQ2 family protein methyltransferase [bacterium]|nr:HemK2/MTQ2 family protein methyltransferase [bacterium]
MTSLWRKFWTRALYWRFLLFQRHRYDHLSLERMGDINLLILPQVFNPALFRTGAMLIEYAKPTITPQTRVLDMGTGSGFGAVACAKIASSVVAVDINPHAVKCATINAMINDVTVTVHEGDLFAPVDGQHFDLILFNPPFFDGEPKTPLDRAWRSTDVIPRFVHGLQAHLSPEGCALVVLSSKGNLPQFLQICADAGVHVEEIAKRDALSEWVLVYRLFVKR